MTLHKTLITLLLLLLAFPTFAQESTEEAIESSTPTEICDAATPADDPESREYSAPLQVLEPGVDYRAVMCTSAGAIYIDLLEDVTPETVNNFIFLTEQNYYNNTIFHRVLEDFMAQAGDPTGTGAGGPGYQFGDEIVGFLTFDRPGLLAMANGGPGTNGSQFFITTAGAPWLNGIHTIFGEVLEGQSETVDNILLRDPAAGGDATTLDTIVIIREPELVNSTFVETNEVATSEDFVAGLDVLLDGESLPPDITANGASTLATDEVIAIVPEGSQEDYAVFLENYGHDYRVSTALDNANCNTDYFFWQMVYSVDAFASAEDATEALNDEFLAGYYQSVGYTAIDTDNSGLRAYSASGLEICGEGDLALVLDVQRGRYVVNVSVVYPASMLNGMDEILLADITASNVLLIFEASLGDIYRSELR